MEEPAAISEPADTTAQPPDEETEDGAAVRSYTAVQAVLTWEEARVYCEARGGCLATVANQAELDEITAMLDAQGLEVVWLGATISAAATASNGSPARRFPLPPGPWESPTIRADRSTI